MFSCCSITFKKTKSELITWYYLRNCDFLLDLMLYCWFYELLYLIYLSMQFLLINYYLFVKLLFINDLLVTLSCIIFTSDLYYWWTIKQVSIKYFDVIVKCEFILHYYVLIINDIVMYLFIYFTLLSMHLFIILHYNEFIILTTDLYYMNLFDIIIY